MNTQPWNELAASIVETLHLEVTPIAITFSPTDVAEVPAFQAPMSEPEPDGRAGRVPAGCVFWMHAVDSTFATYPADHGNCSVGSLTHGLVDLDAIIDHEDVGALLESGWITETMVPAIPTISSRPSSILYGPLAMAPTDPDVVLLRVNGRQLMVIADALPELRIEGKPQCHIVAVAKEQGVPAASVGCSLSRARTGMRPQEMTCALPASQLPDIAIRLRTAASTDATVAKYAARDARRFNVRAVGANQVQAPD